MGEFNWGYYQYHDSYNISYVGNNRQLITHTVTLDGYVLGIEDSEAMSFANNAIKADPPEDLSFPKNRCRWRRRITLHQLCSRCYRRI